MEEKLPTLITATLSPTTLRCATDYTEFRVCDNPTPTKRFSQQVNAEKFACDRFTA